MKTEIQNSQSELYKLDSEELDIETNDNQNLKIQKMINELDANKKIQENKIIQKKQLEKKKLDLLKKIELDLNITPNLSESIVLSREESQSHSSSVEITIKVDNEINFEKDEKPKLSTSPINTFNSQANSKSDYLFSEVFSKNKQDFTKKNQSQKELFKRNKCPASKISKAIPLIKKSNTRSRLANRNSKLKLKTRPSNSNQYRSLRNLQNLSFENFSVKNLNEQLKKCSSRLNFGNQLFKRKMSKEPVQINLEKKRKKAKKKYSKIKPNSHKKEKFYLSKLNEQLSTKRLLKRSKIKKFSSNTIVKDIKSEKWFRSREGSCNSTHFIVDLDSNSKGNNKNNTENCEIEISGLTDEIHHAPYKEKLKIARNKKLTNRQHNLNSLNNN